MTDSLARFDSSRPLQPSRGRTAKASAHLVRRSSRAAFAADSAVRAVGDLPRGGHIFGLTRGHFSMIDLVQAVLDVTGPAALSIWTWCIADYETEALQGLIDDRRITGLRLVIDFAGARRNAVLLRDIQARFGVDCIRVAKTHAKVATIATANGWQVALRGSMNLNANPRFEQFDVSDGDGAFGVIRAIEDEMWARPGRRIDAVTHADAADALRCGPPASTGWLLDGGENWWGADGKDASRAD